MAVLAPDFHEAEQGRRAPFFEMSCCSMYKKMMMSGRRTHTRAIGVPGTSTTRTVAKYPRRLGYSDMHGCQERAPGMQDSCVLYSAPDI